MKYRSILVGYLCGVKVFTSYKWDIENWRYKLGAMGASQILNWFGSHP